jgi:hypothetical protein
MDKLNIGAVCICHEGNTNEHGSYWGRSISGPKRAELLREFYDMKTIRPGYVAIAFSPQRHIKWDEVAWETAGYTK